MIKIITSISLISFSSLCWAAPTTQSLQQFIPQKWEILAQASGDLNTDGQADTVIMVQPKNHKIMNRKLIILFKKNNSFQQIFTKNIPNWTYHSDPNECVEDAFDESSLSIKQQTLDLTFNVQPNCSNTYGLIYSYRFKWIENQFKLIGFDSFSLDKLTGKQDETSINFQTRKAKITENENIFIENQKPAKIHWKNLKQNSSYTLLNIPFSNDEFNDSFANQFL